ncbi:hypothetical protein HN51_017594 [Arachis hypogaea]
MPKTKPDGPVNLMCWKCFIPGKEETDWEGGDYSITLQFCENYPIRPPICKFPKGFCHPHVFSSGEGRKPSITMTQILLGIQDLLNQSNTADAAHFKPNQLFVKDPAEYKRRVQLQAK